MGSEKEGDLWKADRSRKGKSKQEPKKRNARPTEDKGQRKHWHRSPKGQSGPTALQENEGSRLGVHPPKSAADQREFMVSTLWSSKKSGTKEKIAPLPGSKYLKQLE